MAVHGVNKGHYIIQKTIVVSIIKTVKKEKNMPNNKIVLFLFPV